MERNTLFGIMNTIISRTFLVFVLLGSLPTFAQKYSRFHEHPNEKLKFVEKLSKRAAEDRKNAEAWAKQHGVPMREKRGHQVVQLMAIRNGKPLYYTTLNHDAAISTAADQVRTTSPYNLDGAGVTVGVWDGGTARSTHQEFVGRVSVKDPESPYGTDDHATHVTGTIGASGVDANAKGMAPAVLIDSYDWDDDLSGMTSAAASAPGQTNKLYLSNHSYGLNDPTSFFGQYMWDTSLIDEKVASFEYYLPFIAAGNDQALGGYDTISYYGIGKNVMTVGAVRDAVSGGSRSLGNATMTTFSSWGPADDGRIKPDIVANGYRVYSTVASSDTAYEDYSYVYYVWWNGTSMACPNACGSAALLVEYYKELFSGGAMRASTLKGLIIHTADDLGRPGPDYQNGWGLMNTLAAADLLKGFSEGNTMRLKERELSASNTDDTYTAFSSGEPIRVTLCWTDPASDDLTDDDDDRNPDLVNDLDLKVVGPDGTHYPYKLSYSIPTANATASGENNVDNVEQVYIAAPVGGQYTITVDHDGSLSGGDQWYSLLVSGLGDDLDGDGMPDAWETLYLPGATNAVATADSDGDGSDNYTEYMAGTLPNDAGSVFKVTSFSPPVSNGAPFILNWSTVPGRLYSVGYTRDLIYYDFVAFPDATDLPHTQNSYTDTVEHAESSHFYHVEVRMTE